MGRAWPGAFPPSGPERGQDIRLAFVSLLHGLSPRARAVLLHDSVGMTAAEAAAALGISMAAAQRHAKHRHEWRDVTLDQLASVTATVIVSQ